MSLDKLPLPVIPANFYAAGLNYRAHIEWANRAHGTSYKVPERADIGYRSNNALIGSGADIVIPRDSSGQVDFEGELVAVMGPSGSGKTTLLNCLSGLDDIDGGRVLVEGQDLFAMSDARRTSHRAQTMGFIFQAFNLIPVFSAAENVELPLLLNGVPARRARAAAFSR